MPAGGTPRVVDFATHFSGPLASQLLVQLGADVIKVENPRTGDGNRGLIPLIHGQGYPHIALNSGTRSLAANHRSPEWPAIVDACARWADVVIIGARPEDAEARGLGFERFRAANPKIVYCLISGYGETGPWRDTAAHGLNMDAFAGIVPLEQDEEGLPTPRSDYRSYGPTVAGIAAALGIYAGLHQRSVSGESQYVSTSLWGSAIWFNWRDTILWANTGGPWQGYRNLGSRYATYETGDGRVLLVCPIERKFWEPFCDIVGLPMDWKGRGDWSQSGMEFGLDFPEERPVIAERLRTRPLDDWAAQLNGASIPYAPILTLPEVLASDHARAMGVMGTTEVDGHEVAHPTGPVRVFPGGPPPESSYGAPGAVPPAPGIGQHTEEVLAEFRQAGLLT